MKDVARSMDHTCAKLAPARRCPDGTKCICECISCRDNMPVSEGPTAVQTGAADKGETVSFLIPVGCVKGHDPMPEGIPVGKGGKGVGITLRLCRTCKMVFWEQHDAAAG